LALSTLQPISRLHQANVNCSIGSLALTLPQVNTVGKKSRKAILLQFSHLHPSLFSEA
jgi:hypothetical protein